MHYLERLPPWVGYVALTLAIWLVVYLLRKKAPGVWVRLENLLGSKSSVLLGLPSVLAGALVTAAMSDGHFADAWKGALFGALAPLLHHLLKVSPLPYQGSVTRPEE